MIELYSRIRYLLTGGRFKIRKYYESPIYMRASRVYRSTMLGRLSTFISDKSHHMWFDFWNWVSYKLTLFRVRRRIGLFISTFGALWFGFFVAGYG
jgi:hypothetical protein